MNKAMIFTYHKSTTDNIKEMLNWKYEDEYQIYNLTNEQVSINIDNYYSFLINGNEFLYSYHH